MDCTSTKHRSNFTSCLFRWRFQLSLYLSLYVCVCVCALLFVVVVVVFVVVVVVIDWYYSYFSCEFKTSGFVEFCSQISLLIFADLFRWVFTFEFLILFDLLHRFCAFLSHSSLNYLRALISYGIFLLFIENSHESDRTIIARFNWCAHDHVLLRTWVSDSNVWYEMHSQT